MKLPNFKRLADDGQGSPDAKVGQEKHSMQQSSQQMAYDATLAEGCGHD